MIRYETLFLAIPEITTDEARSLETRITKLITEADGSIISFERWGKYLLAYPVRKYDYGIYFLFRFSLKEKENEQLLAQIKSLFAVNYTDLIMRHATHRLPAYATLEYKRPESLEEAPTRDIDSFLKEHKMSGLIQEPAVKPKELVQAAEELEAATESDAATVSKPAATEQETESAVAAPEPEPQETAASTGAEHQTGE